MIPTPIELDEDKLTEALAREVLNWRIAPGRFLKADRGWIPRWRFQPLKQLDHAFFLLDHLGCRYTIKRNFDGTFSAQVRIGGRMGKASCAERARAISLALGRGLQLDGFADQTGRSSKLENRSAPKRGLT
jgi:hypothetical protein